MMPNDTVAREFDVVILGAGFAGICQARHLLLNLPGVRVALVDPRPARRGADGSHEGESLSDIAALFVNKELGLHDYMIQRHAPKQGLSFHWPRRFDETASLDDYFHVWVNRESHISNFHVNRATFERDVLAMTTELGAAYLKAQVLGCDLTSGDAVHTVELGSDAGERFELKASHVVDAAGRRFIVGAQKSNLLFSPERSSEAGVGSARLRVKNVDLALFNGGPDPDNTATTRYYCTNHWFGHGHRVWQIPSWSETKELSVGVVHHHQVIPAESLDGREKFYSFLEKNHHLLYRLVTSGEEVDFDYRPGLSYRSKKMFSRDNWYVIGDAANSFDAFYSHDTSAVAMAVESVTEIVRKKLEGDPEAETTRTILNDFNSAFARNMDVLTSHHAMQLGHASAMSWRIFYEYMWWFGLHVPMYVGKWHLDRGFVKRYVELADRIYTPGGLSENVYETFNEVVDQELNIGLMDVCRADQLGCYAALDHNNDFRFHVKTEPRKCNVSLEWKRMALYMTWWYLRLQWKVRGLGGILAFRNLRCLFGLLGMAGAAGVGDLLHRIRMLGTPSNTVAARNIAASFAYRRQPVLQPWGDDPVTPAGASEVSNASASIGVFLEELPTKRETVRSEGGF